MAGLELLVLRVSGCKLQQAYFVIRVIAEKDSSNMLGTVWGARVT
jgi:hypothetical protein